MEDESFQIKTFPKVFFPLNSSGRIVVASLSQFHISQLFSFSTPFIFYVAALSILQ
jgi:hypothetical protein